MVEFFVYERTESEGDKGITYWEKSELYRRHAVVYYYESEIFDVDVKGIQKEEPLHCFGEFVESIEYSRHIHEKHCENAPKVLHISEKYVQRREYESKTDVEYYQADRRNDKCEKAPVEAHPVNNAENDKHYERQTEIYKRWDRFGK